MVCPLGIAFAVVEERADCSIAEDCAMIGRRIRYLLISSGQLNLGAKILKHLNPTFVKPIGL
jgi:hypothetical protein